MKIRYSRFGGLGLGVFLSLSQVAVLGDTDWPVRDTGTGDTTVQWDHYSLMVRGDRVFSFGGEFHPFRIPVPEIWLDILEKIKAMGMNTMSFYNHWGYHAPWPDLVNFESGAHDITRLYEMSKDVGLWVSARPGPYINAELNGGGLALWSTTGEYGGMRDNSTEWTKAWTPYIEKFDQITAKYQISENGTVILYQIENEYPNQWKDVEKKIPNEVPIGYMENLFQTVQGNGIVVPITHNMPNQKGKSWSVDYDTVGAGGDVHIYGLDNYPSCWSCIPDDCSTSNPSYTLMDYTAHFNEVSAKQPSMMPEFQGGATNPWDGPIDGCQNKTDDRFVSLYYRDNIAQRVTILNLYMIYGGTNWGAMGAPFQTSSYDYSAAISENRTIGTKFYEIKSLALFTRVAHDLTKTNLVGNSTSYTDTTDITTIELRNPDTDAGFYAIRPTDPTSDSNTSFKITVNTSVGVFTVPSNNGNVDLVAHFAKLLVTDFKFGDVTLIYSTAEVLTYAFFDKKPTLALWVFNGEGGEFLIAGAVSAKVVSGDKSRIELTKTRHGLTINLHGQVGRTILQLDNGLRIILMDRDTAHLFWVPALTDDPRVPEDQVAFVHGPYLVRRASLHDSVLSLKGDSDKTTDIEIFTSKDVSGVTWNGEPIQVRRTKAGSLQGRIDGPVPFVAPTLGSWKVRDSLPERWTNYSDIGPAWVEANHTETKNPHNEATKPYLYSDDYGFHNGIHLWRGRFHGPASGMYLDVQGGTTHGWTAYVNGEFLRSFEGDLEESSGAAEIQFPKDTITKGDNDESIILVVQDNAGHDQGSGALNPRGILNATLYDNEGGFSSWKVAGSAGRAVGIDIDPIRTHYSQGGLAAERLGWHLPGYDDSNWAKVGPGDGFSGTGIQFYRTTLTLDTPEGHDISLSVRLSFDQAASSSHFRAYVYINGYQYGKYLPYFAAERNTFPVPPGIWDYTGENVVGLVVWSQDNDKEVKVDVNIDVDYVLASSLDVRFDGAYLRPPYDPKRTEYV